MLARGVQDVGQSAEILHWLERFPQAAWSAPATQVWCVVVTVRVEESAVTAGTRRLFAFCKKLKKPKARLEAANGF